MIDGCRSCGGKVLEPVLSLGSTPLANGLLRREDLQAPEARYPLDLVRCPACTLCQITETVHPELLFGDYPYFSSYSDTLVRHARELAEAVIERCALGPDRLVVEIASNDGYLLQHYARRGIPVLGVEPAANVARVAREQRRIPTWSRFFDRKVAAALRSEMGPVAVVHAHNVLAHVAGLHGVLDGVRTILDSDGVLIAEFPWLLSMIDGGEFDTIYHEHLCYFSLTALVPLFAGHGMRIQDGEKLSIHGGSLRIHAVREESTAVPTERLQALLEEEARWGVRGKRRYRDFAARARELCHSLRTMIERLREEGRTVAGYGASAKGSTLLNVAGIGRSHLDFVADRSPYKQGRFTPGTHLPIVHPDRLPADMPDYVLLLTWNFADEILAQQAEYRRRGGRFIVPIPEVRVIEPGRDPVG